MIYTTHDTQENHLVVWTSTRTPGNCGESTDQLESTFSVRPEPLNQTVPTLTLLRPPTPSPSVDFDSSAFHTDYVHSFSRVYLEPTMVYTFDDSLNHNETILPLLR